MAPPALSTSATGRPLAQLRGFERMYTAIDESSTKTAHVLLVRGAVAPLLAHLPTALMHVYNLHPRMRALQTREPEQHVEIQSPISLEDLATRRLLRVRETTEQEDQAGDWKQHVQEECMRFVNRYEDFPSFLEVWADEANEFARLLLFSDHYMCDGFSGIFILKDTLERVAQLANGEAIDPVEHPLRKSPYNLLLDAYPVSTPLSEFAVKMLAGTVKSLFCSAKPVLPPRSDQADFIYPYKNNPSYAMFGTGSADNLKPILQRCKAEQVTYTGALSAAVLLAYYYASQKYNAVEFGKDFKMIMSMSTNLRLRFGEPVEEDLVGSYASLVSLDRLRNSGTKMTAKFWDLARQCKTEIDTAVKAPTMAFTDIAMDQFFTIKAAPTLFAKQAIPQSCTGDVNISNIGRYPYAMTHSLGDAGELSIETLHLYESVPGIAMGTLMFVSSTKTFNYSMIHKYEDEDAQRLFDAYVAFAERIGSIDADATLADVYNEVKASLE